MKARVAVLAASDRASNGVYADESGPAIVDSLNIFRQRRQTLSTRMIMMMVMVMAMEMVMMVMVMMVVMVMMMRMVRMVMTVRMIG